jgi:hypothetical protein
MLSVTGSLYAAVSDFGCRRIRKSRNFERNDGPMLLNSMRFSKACKLPVIVLYIQRNFGVEVSARVPLKQSQG